MDTIDGKVCVQLNYNTNVKKYSKNCLTFMRNK